MQNKQISAAIEAIGNGEKGQKDPEREKVNGGRGLTRDEGKSPLRKMALTRVQPR